jgi:hypothetical protein
VGLRKKVSGHRTAFRQMTVVSFLIIHVEVHIWSAKSLFKKEIQA